MTASGIQLIVGLGNPGPEYTDTRHNAGFWFVEKLCEQHKLTLLPESKFKGLSSSFLYQNKTVRLLMPTTYMNRSGQAVGALCHFYKIKPEEVLVVHDELDLSVGTARLKLDGGEGGHNGLKDIAAHLATKRFYRLRLGISHPGNREEVLNYVLHRPSVSDKTKIMDAIEKSLTVLPSLIEGHFSKAMTALHTEH